MIEDPKTALLPPAWRYEFWESWEPPAPISPEPPPEAPGRCPICGAAETMSRGGELKHGVFTTCTVDLCERFIRVPEAKTMKYPFIPVFMGAGVWVVGIGWAVWWWLG